MELKQLEYFLKVAEQLNFSRAAESLYISQPALSYQIAELERELGAELFVRDRRKVSLTPEGEALMLPAQEMLEHAALLPDVIRKSQSRKMEFCGLALTIPRITTNASASQKRWRTLAFRIPVWS